MGPEVRHHHLTWETRGRKRLHDLKIFEAYAVERQAPDGRVGTFFELNAPDWVTVIPIVRDAEQGDSFLMVRQYRHGSDRVTVEFPAGTVERGEPAREAALRELLEETGYTPELFDEIGSVSPNPAFMNNVVTTFVADGLTLIKDQELDEHEEIELVQVPVRDVVERLGTDEFGNGIMMIALAFYLRWKGAIDMDGIV